MRILVTGGTGFIGSRLAQARAAAGDHVRVLGRVRNAPEREVADQLRAKGIEVADRSVSERAAIDSVFESVEVVYHLAAAQHEANVPDAYFRDINVGGTRNVMEAALQAGVSRVVHGSTIGVYGWQPGQTVDQQSPLRPDNIYGETKREGEQVVRSFEGRLAFVIARISETYGPGDARLLKLFRGIEKGLFFGIGPGRNLHHLIFVDDLVEALARCARREEALGQTLVLSGPRAVETREMVAAIARELGAAPPRLRVPLPLLLGAAALCEASFRPLGLQPPLHRRRMDFFRKSFRFDGAESASRLGHAPRVGLEEGMRATANYYRERGLIGPSR